MFNRHLSPALIDSIDAMPVVGELWAIEIKRSLAPKLERGFHEACIDLAPVRKILIYPGTDSYPMGHEVQAMPLGQLCAELQSLSG